MPPKASDQRRWLGSASNHQATLTAASHKQVSKDASHPVKVETSKVARNTPAMNAGRATKGESIAGNI